ncbi:MAG: efflux RND transporter periplasmic adaptor subunit [Alphaproteobacteria bacterium]|nr:efflux RND transporter periplasmic adaptor subunit [Alphaproteobacteria bacterium]
MSSQSPRPQDKLVARAPEPARRSWRSLTFGGAALALLLGGYWYFTHESAPRVTGPRRDAAAPVRVARVERRDMAVVERTIGTVVANSNVQVTARVQGQLQAAYFKEGQLVKKGQLLFQIDPRPYQAALDSALANQASAETKMNRYKNLVGSNAIAQMTYDDAQAAYLIAKAAVDTARLNLEYTRITSPVNGKTGAILVQPGNLVTPSASVGASALVNITEIQPIKVSFALPQADLPRIQARAHMPGGLTAQIKLHDAGGSDMSAPVDFVNNAVAGNSGTIELRASFANQDAALVPGQLVDVVVELANLPNALVVPCDAVNNGPDGQFVYVVTPDMTAQEHAVKLLFDDGAFAAISSDIHEGDRVITQGQLRVLPGGKVSLGRGGRGEGGASEGRRGGRGGRRGGGRSGGGRNDG